LREKKGNGNSKKDNGKGCEFHKIPWYNVDGCCLKQSLLVELKKKKTNDGSNFDSKQDKRKLIIKSKASATISTAKIQPKESKELEEIEHFFPFIDVGDGDSTTFHC